MGDDVRFKSHGLAPKSAADFAFLLHGFHFLKDKDVTASPSPRHYSLGALLVERLKTFADAFQPARSRGAVDDTMVEGQAKVHRLADGKLAVADDRFIDDAADSENRGLW